MKVLVICNDPELDRPDPLCVGVSWHGDNMRDIGMVQVMTDLPP